MKAKKATKPTKTAARKLTDIERHARFVETARKVGASENPADFEKAFIKIALNSSQSAKKG